MVLVKKKKEDLPKNIFVNTERQMLKQKTLDYFCYIIAMIG